MIDRNRNIIVNIGLEEIGFRIDNWVFLQTQKKSGCKGIIDLLSKIGLDDANMDLETFTILVMEARNEYLHYLGSKEKINEREACELIDKMGGLIDSLQKLGDGFQSFIPKNPEPPQMVGEISQ